MTRHHVQSREVRLAVLACAVVLAVGYLAGWVAYALGGAW